ncbi:MAG: phosphoribosylformylglycinamidine synthase [Caloramator sp.]|jgi:phosphoribosylformylglycinamidine synthase|uniref:phosphoribosylformylglycinamidine synthase subunit PurL n=1 Tax=Caloramator sp. TaxID=1871330 RepID=UPI001D5BF07F|nr:phosphoribosylformylglycinamidine synthase subunit PurL [Caloramator sp.]MBZ4664233.1 phosphoribosylformylglycinamidine synthase [Caloramator sp.]
MNRYEKVGLTKEEYKRIVEGLNREPNDLELSMLGVLWSEHCSYKNSRALLKLFNTKGERVLQGPGENAGAVDIGDDLAVVFKIESHNHPSALEPYQGAATGVGGILRDIFTMGARPIANLNSIRFGHLNDERNKRLLKGVVNGIGNYGNSVGIPTVAGETVFDDCYSDNPLVNAMSVGIIKKDKLKRAIAQGVGNSVILVGHTTGRDGIGGASFASCNLTEESEAMRSAVQVGDPFMEKLLLEACLELMDKEYVVAVQDLGAAGLTSSSCEMALRGGCGIKIDVSKVVTREENMLPEEIMISESQERMLLVVKKGYEEEILKVFKKWNLNATVIGEITEDKNLTVTVGDEVVGCVPVELLGDGTKANLRPYRRPKYLDELYFDIDSIKRLEDLNEALIKVLKSENIASKEWVYRQYDYMVRTNTIVRPGGDAAVVVVEGTDKALSLTVDCNSRYCYLDPYEGAKIAVCEAARNIAATGATPIAITDCLNFANPEDEEVYYTFRQAILGITEASRVLNTPVVSGNVSFYNESNKTRIYPTPTIGMVGLLEDKNKACTIDFKELGDSIILVGETLNEIGASEYLKVVYGKVLGSAPRCYPEIEKNTIECLTKLIKEGLIQSAHDVSEGGMIVALCECAFKNEIGVEVNVKTNLREDIFLFSESQGRFILSAKKEYVDEIITEFKRYGVLAEVIGETKGSRIEVNINGIMVIDKNICDLKRVWEEELQCIMD